MVCSLCQCAKAPWPASCTGDCHFAWWDVLVGLVHQQQVSTALAMCRWPSVGNALELCEEGELVPKVCAALPGFGHSPECGIGPGWRVLVNGISQQPCAFALALPPWPPVGNQSEQREGCWDMVSTVLIEEDRAQSSSDVPFSDDSTVRAVLFSPWNLDATVQV